MANYSKEFNEVVAEIKRLGYQVYVDSRLSDPTYGYLRDGNKFLYFQIGLEGLTFSVKCVPSHETGSGLGLPQKGMWDKDGLSKTYIEDGLHTIYGRPYSWNSFVQSEARFGVTLKEI